MDGRVFFKGAAANKAGYGDLYAPPGVHEVRVYVSGAGTQKSSNTVSAEFIAKKHMTLKVELRPQPKGNGSNAPHLDSGTQVIADLKTDLFPF